MAVSKCKVVSNSVTLRKITLLCWAGVPASMLEKDEGVVDTNNGVVGIVTEVSENLCGGNEPAAQRQQDNRHS